MASQWSDTDSQPPTEPSGVTTAMGSRVVSPTWSPADQFVQDFPEEHQAAVRAQYASNNVVAAAAAPWCALPANFALVTNRVPPRLTKGSVDLSELVNDLCGQGQVTKTDEEALFELLCETDICSEFCDCISFYHAQGAEAPHLVAIRILLHADSVKWKREFGTQRMTDGYSHKDFAEESCEAMEDALKWNPAMARGTALFHRLFSSLLLLADHAINRLCISNGLIRPRTAKPKKAKKAKKPAQKAAAAAAPAKGKGKAAAAAAPAKGKKPAAAEKKAAAPAEKKPQGKKSAAKKTQKK